MEVTDRIPQSCPLEPLLYLLYIYDLKQTEDDIIAEDTEILKRAKHEEVVIYKVQITCHKITSWTKKLKSK